MLPVKVFVRCVALCLLLSLAGVDVARAQANAQPCSKANEIKDFVKISDMRDRLLLSISDLEDEIDTLREQIPEDIEESKRELANLQQGLTAINRKPARATEAENEPAANTSDVVSQRISTLETQIKNFDANKSTLAKKESELADSKTELECLQERIRSLLTPEQEFKLTMSKYFAALVGLVILGFFVMAGWDITVRRAIFSGATGIQFLTLFSIVIAIILFGITGILQDKELAALLGGLSGYILGRYNTPDQNRDNNDEANAPQSSPP
jgi:hypothetical protein